MVPILYAADAIKLLQSNGTYYYEFPNNNGLGGLSEALSCKVTEERNGPYELEMVYPVQGKRFKDLAVETLIKASHDDTKNTEFFRVYKITKPMNGRITVMARHISYYLSKVTVMPFEEAIGPSNALNLMIGNSIPRHGFKALVTLSSNTRFSLDTPQTFRSVLGGSQDSILDTYGGEFEWSGDTIYLRDARNAGIDSGVVFRYGKNITDLKETKDSSGVWTGIVPYWKGDDDGVELFVTLDAADLPVSATTRGNYAYEMVIPVDLTDKFDNVIPTKAELKETAQRYVSVNAEEAIPTTIEVSFINLWQTEEYKNVAALERLRLCDTLTIRHEAMGIDYTAKIIKVEYDVLLDRYNSMTIGQASSNIVDAIRSASEESLQDVATTSAMMRAIQHATRLLQGGAGGHMVQGVGDDGKPHELYFMDTDDVNTAVKVLRINMNGIGFSSNGFNGPYHSAWTLDGRFVADYICAGSINASLIDTGELNADLIKTGVFKVIKKDEYGNPILDSQGKEQVLMLADADKGELHIMADSFSLTSGETIQSIAASEASGAFQNLTQKQVFDILTNNSQDNGIHLVNGVLYLDFTYAEGGILKLGGLNNGRGQLVGYQVYNYTHWSDNTGRELREYFLDSAGLHFDAYGLVGYIDWTAGGGVLGGSASAIRCNVKHFSTDSNGKRIFTENPPVTERRVIDMDAHFGDNANGSYDGIRLLSDNICMFARRRLQFMRWQDPDELSTTGYYWVSFILTEDGFKLNETVDIDGGLKVIPGMSRNKGIKQSWRYPDGSEEVTDKVYAICAPAWPSYFYQIDNYTMRSYQVNVNHLNVYKTVTFEGLKSGLYSSTTPVLAIESDGDVYTITPLGSSKRYKTVGKQVTAEDIKGAYGINVYMATYKPGYLADDDQRVGAEWPMFVVEQMYEHVPIAVDMKDGQCETWNAHVIIPIMFQMIKDQKASLDAQQEIIDEQQRQLDEQQKLIDSLEERIIRLEEKLK